MKKSSLPIILTVSQFADLDLAGETDLAEIDFVDDLDDSNIVDLSKELSSKEGGHEAKAEDPKKEVKGQSVGKTASVARGADARLLLDSRDGRNALINDLEELSAFLTRAKENLTEFQAADFNLPEEKGKKKVTGLNIESIAPIYHQIMLVSCH